jgi:hypothetical protein
LSYPDIALLSKLAHILEVTTNELLNGEAAEQTDPGAEMTREAEPQHAGAAGKSAIAVKAYQKLIAVGLGTALLSVLIFIVCDAAVESGLGWAITPLGITTTILVLATLGAYVTGKNKIGALLLCGTVLYLTTHYYSALNASPAQVATAGSFSKVYLPHYTIEIVLFITSIALIVTALWARNKNHAGDILFSLAAASVTILILSLLTVSAMIDYVDLNGLGVDAKFTILILFTLLMNLILLAILARRCIRQSHNAPPNSQRL